VAKEIVLSRNYHIDLLLEKIKEPRALKVLNSVILGENKRYFNHYDDDGLYCLSMGLIKKNADDYLIAANPIYADVIIRTLTLTSLAKIPTVYVNRWLENNTFRMKAIMEEFLIFMRDSAKFYPKNVLGHESGAYLLLLSFFQRVTCVDVQVIREYDSGRKNLNMCLNYGTKNFPIEMMMANSKSDDKSLTHLIDFMDRRGSKEGWFLIFNQYSPNSKKKYSCETKILEGDRIVHVLNC